MKITAIKFTPEQIRKMDKQLQVATFLLTQDVPLDWETREEIARSVWDARETIKEAHERAAELASGLQNQIRAT